MQRYLVTCYVAENCLLYLTRKITFILNVSTCTICICTGTCKMKWQKLSFFTKQPLFSQLVVLSIIVIVNNCLINGNRYRERVLCVAYQKKILPFHVLTPEKHENKTKPKKVYAWPFQSHSNNARQDESFHREFYYD